jgi:hypothetical protein
MSQGFGDYRPLIKKSSLLQEQVWQQANNVPVPQAFRIPCVVSLCTPEKHQR